jgi:hypothetical protein
MDASSLAQLKTAARAVLDDWLDPAVQVREVVVARQPVRHPPRPFLAPAVCPCRLTAAEPRPQQFHRPFDLAPWATGIMLVMTIQAVVFDIGGVLEVTPDLGVTGMWESRLGLGPGERPPRGRTVSDQVRYRE